MGINNEIEYEDLTEGVWVTIDWKQFFCDAGDYQSGFDQHRFEKEYILTGSQKIARVIGQRHSWNKLLEIKMHRANRDPNQICFIRIQPRHVLTVSSSKHQHGSNQDWKDLVVTGSWS